MRLTQVRDFVAVVESGSIRAAARKLSVSQPAITKSVRGLEGELQVRLLQRSSKGIVPTPSGRAFFVRARVAQSELRERSRIAQRVSLARDNHEAVAKQRVKGECRVELVAGSCSDS